MREGYIVDGPTPHGDLFRMVEERRNRTDPYLSLSWLDGLLGAVECTQGKGQNALVPTVEAGKAVAIQS